LLGVHEYIFYGSLHIPLDSDERKREEKKIGERGACLVYVQMFDRVAIVS
jgi:hypothetical protein